MVAEPQHTTLYGCWRSAAAALRGTGAAASAAAAADSLCGVRREQNTEEESYEIMDYCLSRGVNFLDTAEL